MAQRASLPGTGGKKEYNIATGLACMSLGWVAIFGSLFSIGHFLYGNYIYSLLLLVVSIIATFIIYKLWGRLFD